MMKELGLDRRPFLGNYELLLKGSEKHSIALGEVLKGLVVEKGGGKDVQLN